MGYQLLIKNFFLKKHIQVIGKNQININFLHRVFYKVINY